MKQLIKEEQMKAFRPGDPVRGKQHKKGNDGERATATKTRGAEDNLNTGKDSGRGTENPIK